MTKRQVTCLDWANPDRGAAFVGNGIGLPALESRSSCECSGILSIPQAEHRADKIRMVDLNRPPHVWLGDTAKELSITRISGWQLLNLLNPSKKPSNNTCWPVTDNTNTQKALSELLSAYWAGLFKSVPDASELIIVPIPEYFDMTSQEVFLSSCPRRDQVRLVWQSIASCLGVPDLNYRRFKSGDTVGVLDLQSDRMTLSILHLEIDTDQAGTKWVVPLRKPYYVSGTAGRNTLNYPLEEELVCDDFIHALAYLPPDYPDPAALIWYLSRGIFAQRHGAGDNFYLPLSTGWTRVSKLDRQQAYKAARRKFPTDKSLRDLIQALRRLDVSISPSTRMPNQQDVLHLAGANSDKFKHLIVTGAYLDRLELTGELFRQSGVRGDIMIETLADPYLIRGAATYGVRSLNQLPTYFDYRERLGIVTQRPDEELIDICDVIKEGKSRGGEKYEGTTIGGIFIEAMSKQVEFFLQLGSSSKLRKLTQTFDIQLAQRAPLTLHPSMIPSQGYARVTIENDSLFKTPVFLDWNLMAETAETVHSLEAKIRRSFPPDIPNVEADESAWNNVASRVEQYVNHGAFPASNLIYQPRWPYGDSTDVMEQLRRTNTFGNSQDHSIPKVTNLFNIDLVERFLDQLATDYTDPNNASIRADILRLIAWTYQGERFKAVRKDLITSIKSRSLNLKQEHTACATLFRSPAEFKIYFDGFLLNAYDPQGEIKDFRGIYKVLQRHIGFATPHTARMGTWLRGLGRVLSFNNYALQEIDSDRCRAMMRFILVALEAYWGLSDSCSPKAPVNWKNCVILLLFMLRRRHFDRSFFPYREGRQETEDDRILGDLVRSLQRPVSSSSLDAIRSGVLGFLIGRGSLESIPCMVDNNDD